MNFTRQFSLLRLLLMFSAVPIAFGYWHLRAYAAAELLRHNTMAGVNFRPFDPLAFFLRFLFPFSLLGGNSVGIRVLVEYLSPVLSIWIWMSVAIIAFTPSVRRGPLQAHAPRSGLAAAGMKAIGFFSVYLLLYGLCSAGVAFERIPFSVIHMMLLPLGLLVLDLDAPWRTIAFAANGLMWAAGLSAIVAWLARRSKREVGASGGASCE